MLLVQLGTPEDDDENGDGERAAGDDENETQDFPLQGSEARRFSSGKLRNTTAGKNIQMLASVLRLMMPRTYKIVESPVRTTIPSPEPPTHKEP